MKSINYDNFSLVLSGGGALGIAHLGVIEDLEKMHILPKEIIGTSVGGIIGACLAIGLREQEIFNLCEKFASIFHWIKFSMTGHSMIVDNKIKNIFDGIFKDFKMKDTKIPLKLIATDMQNGEAKVFTAKDNIYIKNALLATMAIPGIFEEQIIDNKIYCDGFICENLGINYATLDDILAVDVLGKNSFEHTLPNHKFKTKNILNMFEKSLRLIIYNQTKNNVKNIKKNICLLEPETKGYKTFSFHKYKKLKQLGKDLLVHEFKIL